MTDPDCWELRLGKTLIAIERRESPTSWWMRTAGAIRIERPLLSEDPDAAKAEAVDVVRSVLASILELLPRRRRRARGQTWTPHVSPRGDAAPIASEVSR